MQQGYTHADNQPAYDFTGRLVYSLPLTQSGSSSDIAATNLSLGVYMYRVVSGGVTAGCGKVVVIK